MNKNALFAIVKKDIKAVTASVQMWLPMVIVPAVFVIGLPLIILLIFSTQDISSNPSNVQYIERVLRMLPQGAIRDELMSFDTLNQKMTYFFLNYSFAPMFLLIPSLVSTIIASNSFVGEKERKTLESLLYSPLSEGEMLFAKVLASFIPSMVISIASVVVYGLIIDLVGYPLFNKIIFPTSNWLVLVLWIVPSITLFSIYLCVLISAKVKGFQESQQMSILVILPVMGLFIAQMTGFMVLSNWILLGAGLVLFGIDFLLIRLSPRFFSRQSLFMSQH